MSTVAPIVEALHRPSIAWFDKLHYAVALVLLAGSAITGITSSSSVTCHVTNATIAPALSPFTTMPPPSTTMPAAGNTTTTTTTATAPATTREDTCPVEEHDGSPINLEGTVQEVLNHCCKDQHGSSPWVSIFAGVVAVLILLPSAFLHVCECCSPRRLYTLRSTLVTLSGRDRSDPTKLHEVLDDALVAIKMANIRGYTLWQALLAVVTFFTVAFGPLVAYVAAFLCMKSSDRFDGDFCCHSERCRDYVLPVFPSMPFAVTCFADAEPLIFAWVALGLVILEIPVMIAKTIEVWRMLRAGRMTKIDLINSSNDKVTSAPLAMNLYRWLESKGSALVWQPFVQQLAVYALLCSKFDNTLPANAAKRTDCDNAENELKDRDNIDTLYRAVKDRDTAIGLRPGGCPVNEVAFYHECLVYVTRRIRADIVRLAIYRMPRARITDQNIVADVAGLLKTNYCSETQTNVCDTHEAIVNPPPLPPPSPSPIPAGSGGTGGTAVSSC
eukprot:m.71074 g.71074  ORF g.71074 m.71074 type:complete len:500 (+) comp14134_c0_seq1:166-1665(+)